MMISRCIRYCLAALAMCVGGFAFAEPAKHTTYLAYSAVSAFESAGAYGHDVALFAARQAEMTAANCSHSALASGLLKDSHGFMQATADEVAKGTTGSTVSLYS